MRMLDASWRQRHMTASGLLLPPYVQHGSSDVPHLFQGEGKHSMYRRQECLASHGHGLYIHKSNLSAPHGLLTCCMAAPLPERVSQQHEAVIALSLWQQQVLRPCWCTTCPSILGARARGRLPGPAFILPVQLCCHSKPFPLLRRDCPVNLTWLPPSLRCSPVHLLCSVT